MLPVNVDTTAQQADAQREEQRRQTFRLWLGASLSTSLLFISQIVFQNTEDRWLRFALLTFIVAIVLSGAAYFVREAGNHTTSEYIWSWCFAYSAGVATFIGLGLTIWHYDPFASTCWLATGFLAAVIIRFLDTRRAAS